MKKCEITTQKLRELVARNPRKKIPSLHALSRTWNVSYNTLRKAALSLVDEGVLRMRQGKPIESVAHSCGKATWSQSDLLADEIRNKIESGDYTIGECLPKQRYFSIQKRVSSATVTQTFTKLAERNIIHKDGKRWIAGPPRPQVIQQRFFKPVVLILTSCNEDFVRLASSPHTSPFLNRFDEEIRKFGYTTETIFITTDEMLPAPQPSSIPQAAKRIQQLGNRYCGTLISCMTQPTEIIDMWIAFLCTYDRPVVFFDHDGSFPRGKRKKMRTGSRNFFLLRLDLESAVGLALRTIVDAGHGNILMIDYRAKVFDWAVKRIALAQKLCKMHRMPLSITVREQTIDLWTPRYWTRPIPFNNQKTTKRCRIGYSNPSYALPDTLRNSKRFPTKKDLCSLIEKNGITAIITPNDMFALQYFFLLHQMQIAVPETLSLLSFDNNPEMRHLPVSTIDFGFPRLGYFAAHLFLNDLSSHVSRTGETGGVPSLVDRGSIALRAEIE